MVVGRCSLIDTNGSPNIYIISIASFVGPTILSVKSGVIFGSEKMYFHHILILVCSLYFISVLFLNEISFFPQSNTTEIRLGENARVSFATRTTAATAARLQMLQMF